MNKLSLLLAVALSAAACSRSEHKGGRHPEPSEPARMKFEGETFGRFIGTLHHERLGKDQYVKLDFVPSRVARNNELEIRAVFNLYFGNFDSQEYVSYHFENVRFDLVTRTLVFNQEDQQLSLVTTEFTADKLVASVHAGAAKIGTLTMARETAKPERAFIDQIGGEYTGFCDGKPNALNLWTSRTLAESSRVGNPFGTYEISGTMGEPGSTFCGLNSSDRTCVVEQIRGGSYDFFAGSLQLTGQRGNYTCSVDGSRLDCGSCFFSRLTPSSAQTATPFQSKNLLMAEEASRVADQALPGGESLSISGEYYGFVHHEQLNVYQRGKLGVQAFQQPEGGSTQLMMAATAQLFFGEATTGQAISYTFNPREFDLTNQVFLFERMHDDVDAMILVTSLGGGKVSGVWYSQYFGRVGTFEFYKAGFPTLPPEAAPFKGIGGVYNGKAYEVSLVPRLDATPVNSLNPFFPLAFGGLFRLPDVAAEWVQIEEGSYDFYTGKVGFRTVRGQQMIAGAFDAGSGKLAVTKQASGISTFQELYTPEILTRR